MKFLVFSLIIFIILLLLGVVFFRKYYIDWCKSCRDKRRSRDLCDKMEFLIKFISVMLLLIIFVATMIYDCLSLEGR